jgi:hypothetical protein
VHFVLKVYAREGGRKQTAKIMDRLHAVLHDFKTDSLSLRFDSSAISLEKDGWTFEGMMHFIGTPTPLSVNEISATASFQARVAPWMQACFGPEIAGDTIERNHRFIEEALELVQACGATESECHQLVDYVFNRPVGEPHQESGGVMVTHAALCLANGLDMHENGEVELARIWGKVETIRAKQAAKPKHSPLPQATVREASDYQPLTVKAHCSLPFRELERPLELREGMVVMIRRQDNSPDMKLPTTQREDAVTL